MIHLISPNPAVDRTILLETLLTGSPNRPLEVKDFAGGKSFNVAYALLQEPLDHSVVVHTILGGENGQRVSRLAQEAGVDVQAVWVKQNTRECNIVVDTQAGTIYPIYEQGFTLTESLLAEYTEQIVASVNPGDYVVFSGSLMQGMPEDYIVQVQQAIDDDSVRFLVDTSGPAMKATFETGHPWVVKINDEEYNELFDTQFTTKADFFTHLQQLDHPSIKYFILTLGGEGALAFMDGDYYDLVAPSVTVKNPIASGDFFLGGLLHGFVASDTHEGTLRRGMANATTNVQHWYPHIDSQEYHTIYETIVIEKREEE